MLILNDESMYGGAECALALGMFDGVHLGHKALIDTVVRLARADGIVAAAVTFKEHPLEVLSPGNAPVRLCTNIERALRMDALGLDTLVMRRFTQEYAAQPPELFLERLCREMHPRYIVAGYNYTFGSRGAGDSELLKRLGGRFGYKVGIIEPVLYSGEPVSSTRIRALLAEGNTAEAEKMMPVYKK